MNKEQAKIKIQDLISKYEATKASGKISKYTEEDTKKDEIAKTDKKIDEEVYKLYGLGKEEIRVMEAKISYPQ